MTARAAGALGALLVVALLGAACGRKGPPVAPEFREPRPPTALGAVASASGIELSWRNPERRADNSRVRDLTLARVFRSDDAGVGDPRPAIRAGGRIAGYRELATIRLADPGRARVEGGRVVLVDAEGLEHGRRYTYVVLAEDAHGRVSPPSSRLSVSYAAPPAAPTELRADAGDGEVRLTWQPPPGLATGDPASGTIMYEVLRALAPETTLVAITSAPQPETTFTDRGVVNDRAYVYAVRAVRAETGATTRGESSERVTATPADATPPAAPVGLAAVPSARTVRLAWTASAEPDVAAYLVYRASGRGDFVRIGTVRPPQTTFLDPDVEPGIYRYAVTAQDGSPRANESVRSREVTVTVP